MPQTSSLAAHSQRNPFSFIAQPLLIHRYDGSVLAGFREAPISFLPSYRRVVGAAGAIDAATASAAATSSPVPLRTLQATFTTAMKHGERH